MLRPLELLFVFPKHPCRKSQLTPQRSSYAFLARDAPEYKTGYSICIAFVCLSGATCIVYAISILVQNRNRDRAGTDLGLTEYEKTEKGDMSPDYRYLL